jgi:hypothetical protein
MNIEKSLKDTKWFIDSLHRDLDELDAKLGATGDLSAEDVARRNRKYAILGEMYHNKRFIEAELSK